MEKVNWDRSSDALSWSVNEGIGYKLRLSFGQDLEQGKIYVISLGYVANIRTDIRGFYQSHYSSEDNVKHYMGVTQFESVDARAAFPCFDEPSFKATFKVSITLEAENVSEYVILSNTGEESSKSSGPNSRTVVFKRTPRMSTYLLAWVVGEMDSIHDSVVVGGRTVPVSLYAPIHQADKGKYAIETAVKVVQALVEYWDIKECILDKLDVLAIPDFDAGAMENFGLITFRTVYLLLESDATVGEKEGVALVLSHELSHQVTGNIYTTEWWSSLFLNEGFANFFEHHLSRN